jgi:acetate kinase
LAGLDINHSKLIICHIGSGASISAVVDGKSVDTSMGMTPLEGLVMGTRSGDLDAAIVEYISEKEGKSVGEVIQMLNKQSGVLGISGISNDYRDLVAAEAEGSEAAHNALEVMIYRIAKYVGSYYVGIGGADAIALTAGAGENNLEVRGRIVESLSALGISLNKEVNTVRGEELCLSTPDSKIPVWVVPTNEELKIARETANTLFS